MNIQSPFVQRRPTSIAETLAAARGCSPDPFPDEPGCAASDTTWYYAEGEYEAGVLDRIVRDSDAVAKHSAYATNYRRPAGELAIDVRLLGTNNPIRLQIPGEVRVLPPVDATVSASEGDLAVTAPRGGILRLYITAPSGEPATCGVTDAVAVTGAIVGIEPCEETLTLQTRRGAAFPPPPLNGTRRRDRLDRARRSAGGSGRDPRPAHRPRGRGTCSGLRREPGRSALGSWRRSRR